MIMRWLQSIHPRRQPWITRQSYHYELISSLCYPVAMSMIEGSIIGVLARKMFEVGPMMFAIIIAAPMFANLTSIAWARLARGRRKVRFINVLQVGVLLCVGGIAVLPIDANGASGLVILTLLAYCFLAGIVTIRSVIWRMNYPRRTRAQVTGRLIFVSSLVVALAPLMGYALLDRNEESFRIVYPTSVLIALVGVVAFSRVRLRGERDLLRFESEPTARPQPHGGPGALYEYDPRPGRDNFWTILRRDRFFRWYMLLQFVGGMANMIGEVVMIYVIASLTDHMKHQYQISIFLTAVLPMLLVILSFPMWARYLDRVHVVHLRSRQGYFWIAVQLLNWLGVMNGSLAVIGLARVGSGMQRAGGMMAWQLGHNDFADRRLAAQYMGIHVTLTGVRGVIGPFLAMALFIGWPDLVGPLNIQITQYAGIGAHIFLMTAGLSVMATVGFHILNQFIARSKGRIS